MAVIGTTVFGPNALTSSFDLEVAALFSPTHLPMHVILYVLHLISHQTPPGFQEMIIFITSLMKSHGFG